MNYMDIPRVREYDSGQIRVVAKNTEGEAEASTVLNVLPKEDWRSQLRQAPKGELEIELDRKRKIELKNVEFKRPFEIPKAADYELKQIERGKVSGCKHWGSIFFFHWNNFVLIRFSWIRISVLQYFRIFSFKDSTKIGPFNN